MSIKEHKTQMEPYQYRDCGLDNVCIHGGRTEVTSPYGKGVTIHDLDGLHRCIGQCLVNKPAPLTGAEFRFLRTELDLSQSAMGDLCGRGERMVRDWEARSNSVEEPANTIIRFVYEQRYNPTANFEALSKAIRHSQAAGKAPQALDFHDTAAGWKRVVGLPSPPHI